MPFAGRYRTIRILILSDSLFPDFIGGIEARNLELGRALAARGHRVTLAGYGKGLPSPALEVESLGALPGLYRPNGRRRTRRALEFGMQVASLDIGRFDVIETPQMPYTHLFPLALRARRAGVPLVVTWYEVWGRYWGHYVGTLQAPIYRGIEVCAAQLGTAVTASSELTRERLAQLRRGSAPERIPCGIDLDRMRNAAGRAEVRRAGLVFAGRLIAHKRLDLLIAAMAILAARMVEPPRLVIFGEGPAKEELQAQATALGVDRHIDFRGHLPSSDELWTAIAGHSVAVQPSAREGFGLFPLEAMALGLPVVCCRSPETALDELVRHEQEGLWTEPDPHHLAAILERIHEDQALRERLAAAARVRAAAYSWSEVAAGFESLFLRLRP